MAKSTFEQLQKILGPMVVAPRAMLFDDRLTDPERRVLLSLYSFSSDESLTVWPSLKSIAERAAVKDHTRISKITNRLQELNWLTKGRKGFSNLVIYKLAVPEYAKSIMVEAGCTGKPPLSKLDCESNSDGQSNSVSDTNSKLDSDTNSKLDSESNSKEVSTEVSIEVSTFSATSPKINGHAKPDPMDIRYRPPIAAPPPPEQPAEQSTEQVPDESQAAATPKVVADLYNEVLGEELRSVKQVNSARQRQIRARIKENANRQSPAWWKKYFTYVRDCDFLMGRGPPRPNSAPWKATFDWLINESNMTKVIEKNYEQPSERTTDTIRAAGQH